MIYGIIYIGLESRTELSTPRPAGLMRPSTAINAARHKIINVLKTH